MTRFWRASGWVAVGFAAGVIAATAGVSVAALARKGWERFGLDFKQGYVSGFIDATRIAKAYDPSGYLSRQYRIPPKAPSVYWVRTLDELYKKPEHEARTVWQLMAIAGPILEKQFGPEGVVDPKAQLGALADALERAAANEEKRRRQTAENGQTPVAGAKQGAGGEALSDGVSGERVAASAAPTPPAEPGPKHRRRACLRACRVGAETEPAGDTSSAPVAPKPPSGDTAPSPSGGSSSR